jgi:hypothetical protein
LTPIIGGRASERDDRVKHKLHHNDIVEDVGTQRHGEIVAIDEYISKGSEPGVAGVCVFWTAGSRVFSISFSKKNCDRSDAPTPAVNGVAVSEIALISSRTTENWSCDPY